MVSRCVMQMTTVGCRQSPDHRRRISVERVAARCGICVLVVFADVSNSNGWPSSLSVFVCMHLLQQVLWFSICVTMYLNAVFSEQNEASFATEMLQNLVIGAISGDHRRLC